MTTFYRKLWIKHNGPIPVDEYGVSYEIHHVDGDRSNNELSNLRCLSISEHYQVHFDQGDFQAALLILEKINNVEQLRLIGHTPKTLAAYMVENELGLWSKSAKQKAIQTKRDRKVGFCHDSKWASIGGKVGGAKGAAAANEIHKANRTGFYSSENQSVYGKLGGKAAAPKLLGLQKEKVVCPHCGKVGGGQALMNRWHFDNCKKLIDSSYKPTLTIESEEPYVPGESWSERTTRLKKTKAQRVREHEAH